MAGHHPLFRTDFRHDVGQHKKIPITYEMLKANSQAIQDLLSFHIVWCPFSRVWRGKGLLLGGSTDLRELAPGISCGDLSGIEANEIPWWAESYVFPPRDLALLADWEEKMAPRRFEWVGVTMRC